MIQRVGLAIVAFVALGRQTGLGQDPGEAERIADQLLARFVINVSLHTMVKEGALDRIAAQPRLSIEEKLAWGLVIANPTDKEVPESAVKLSTTLERTVGKRLADNSEHLNTGARLWVRSFTDDGIRKPGDQIEVAMDLSVSEEKARQIVNLAVKLQGGKTAAMQTAREKVRRHFLDLAKADRNLDSALHQIENPPIEVANARQQLVAVLAKAKP